MPIPTIRWSKDAVKMIDQTQLPGQLKFIYCRDLKTLWEAIKTLKIRGAPALGVAAAFGLLLAAKKFKGSSLKHFKEELKNASDYLGASRPTAVNLFNALKRIKAAVDCSGSKSVMQIKKIIQREAFKIYEEDRRICRRMGERGARLIRSHQRLMTVCNAGALATVDYGTALGVMYSAQRNGKKFTVYACETRPLLQGARLTAWELVKANIETILICDNMAATLMKQGKVDSVFVGADRIAANGDTANKIGTYNLAILAKYHRIPFYVAAPLSTFDLTIKTGGEIPIEERAAEEVRAFHHQLTAPQQVKVYNPAFDVTDHHLITAIITEEGIIYPPLGKNIKKIFG